MLRAAVVLILMINFVSALDVDFDCPDDIYVDEEFECDVKVNEGEGIYDLKVEIDKKRDSALKIFCSERGWISAYYYLIDFVKNEEVVKLKIEEEGRYNVVLKLRKEESREEFDVGKIKVEKERVIEEVEEEQKEERFIKTNHIEPIEKEQEEIKIISLNGDAVLTKDSSEEKWDYVSKDGMVIDWLPYGFCLFLIFLVGVMSWDKFAR